MSIHYKSLIIFFTILALFVTNSYAQPTHTPGTPWPGYVGYYFQHYPNGTVKEEGIEYRFNSINERKHLPGHLIRYARNGKKTFEYWTYCQYTDTIRKHFLFIPYKKKAEYLNEDTAIVYDENERIIAKGHYTTIYKDTTKFWQYYDSNGYVIKQVYYEGSDYYGEVKVTLSNGQVQTYRVVKRSSYPVIIKELYIDGKTKSYYSYYGDYEKQFYPSGHYKAIFYTETKNRTLNSDNWMYLNVYFDETTEKIIKIERLKHAFNATHVYDQTITELPLTPELINNLPDLKKIKKKGMITLKYNMEWFHFRDYELK